MVGHGGGTVGVFPSYHLHVTSLAFCPWFRFIELFLGAGIKPECFARRIGCLNAGYCSLPVTDAYYHCILIKPMPATPGAPWSFTSFCFPGWSAVPREAQQLRISTVIYGASAA